jgi:flavin-dependent dehydrogenase
MAEPTEPKEAIAPENWEQFLRDFAMRNNNRRARFDVFRRGGAVEEEQREEHLEDLVLKSDGNAKSVEVIRIDRADRNAEKTRDVITNVRGITVQYDTDGSEDALEITDDQDTLVSLRLESRIDGNS